MAALPSSGSSPATQQALPLVVADFNQGGWFTNLGHPFGGWQGDPGDPTQFFRVRLVEAPRLGEGGYGLQIEYDAESPNPAYGGLWIKLGRLSLQPYRTVSFAIRGDADRGFTSQIKLEIKGRGHAAQYLLAGLTGDWVRFRIPLKAFAGIEHVRVAEEFVIVLDQETVTQGTGTLYLEDLALETLS